MSLNLTVKYFIYLFYIHMEKYVVWNVAGLTKFTKGEVVLSDMIKDDNWEVRVYKTDCDGDILVNDRGNKVSYTLAANRLKPVNIENLAFSAGTLEQRVMQRTFTDKKLDKATDYIVTVNNFSDLTMKLRNKLWSIANNLMWKVNELTISADAYDAEAFDKTMNEMAKLVKFLEGDPMTNIKALFDTLVGEEPEETYDPKSILN